MLVLLDALRRVFIISLFTNDNQLAKCRRNNTLKSKTFVARIPFGNSKTARVMRLSLFMVDLLHPDLPDSEIIAATNTVTNECVINASTTKKNSDTCTANGHFIAPYCTITETHIYNTTTLLLSSCTLV